jgi:tetratricopeptide (TPR) repeat protein
MALDPYSICPCGSGKKIKFCCSKDIIAELGKIMRAIEGDQRAAALDQINKAIKEKGERESLLGLKANLQIALGEVAAAEPTIEKLAKAVPHNPVALALTAVVEATKEHPEAAVEKLQQALESVDEHMPHAVYSAIGVVAHALIASGNVLAARGHLMMQAALAGENDTTPLRLLMQMNASPHLPVLLKEDFVFAECPPDAPWRGEFSAAMNSGRRGAWLAACESLTSLSEKVPGQPAIIRNIAILRGSLGQLDQAIAKWREFASLEDVPLDDAVEAEALAQLLDKSQAGETVDELTLTYPIHDADKLLEQLIANRRVENMPIDLHELADEDSPPPRGAFYLLDRELPETGAELVREHIPLVLGEMYVYGRETDREARLEFALERSPDLGERKQALSELAGQLLGELDKEEITGEVPAHAAALSWQWRLPDDTPPQRRKSLMEEQHREMLLQRWPTVPHPALGGKSPRDAADDPVAKVPVLAAILVLELTAEEANQAAFDFNELRTKLQLPRREPLSAAQIDIRSLPVTRFAVLDVEGLKDDDLVLAFRRAMAKQYRTAVYRLAKEFIRRDLQAMPFDLDEVYAALIECCPDSDESLEYVEQARNRAVSEGKSPASWLLTELSIRIPRLESEEANRLLQTLRARHLQEPGVAQALHEMLVGFGIIRPDGQPGDAPPAAPSAAPAAAQPAAAAPGEIWTPDSAKTAGEGEGKSKLWVPGMD